MKLDHTRLGHAYLGLRRRVIRLSLRKPAGKPVSRAFGVDRGTAIDRYWIEPFLATHASSAAGHVLESGGTTYSERFYPNMKASEMEISVQTKPNGVVCDLEVGNHALDGIFDVMIATQLFNFIFDVRAALAHAAAMLRPGGLLVGSVAGITQVSRFDADRWGHYYSFTEQSWRKLLAQHFDSVTVETRGNVDTACAFLNGLCAEELDPALLAEHDPDYPVSVLFAARTAAG